MIKRFIDNDESYIVNHKFDYARFLIFDYIVTCINNDRDNGNYNDRANNNKLTEAGKIIYDLGGITWMKDEFIWSIVPKRYHYQMNMMWKGIGEWGN